MFCNNSRSFQSAAHKSVETADLLTSCSLQFPSPAAAFQGAKPRIERGREGGREGASERGSERSFVLLGKMFNSGRLNQKERTDGRTTDADGQRGSG